MTRLAWSTVGQRFYEAGADRGVFYPATGPGVTWDGLTSVSENPVGGDPVPYYIDGFKYLNLASAEEFAATLSAFSSPAEFAEYDGTVSVSNGLFITNQPRKSFGLCYRTRVGNDVDGLDLGYKLHLVYNALAAPASRGHETLTDDPEPLDLSWTISTMAPAVVGYRPTAHLVVDSRTTPETLLATFEDILYGTVDDMPRLPTIQEVITLFTTEVVNL